MRDHVTRMQMLNKDWEIARLKREIKSEVDSWGQLPDIPYIESENRPEQNDDFIKSIGTQNKSSSVNKINSENTQFKKILDYTAKDKEHLYKRK